MTSAKPSPLTSPRATEEPAASSMPAPSILNPFDPSRFATLMTDEIPGMTISPISQESAARCLQDEIFRRGIDDPVQLDLEVGNPVAVEIAADDRNVVGSAGLIELLVAKFACTAVKVLRADESEGLIALFGRVRIDARKIDLVLPRMEVSDDIAGEWLALVRDLVVALDENDFAGPGVFESDAVNDELRVTAAIGIPKHHASLVIFAIHAKQYHAAAMLEHDDCGQRLFNRG